MVKRETRVPRTAVDGLRARLSGRNYFELERFAGTQANHRLVLLVWRRARPRADSHASQVGPLPAKAASV